MEIKSIHAAIPATLILFAGIIILRIVGITTLDNPEDGDEVKKWMNFVIPAGILVFPLKYAITVAFKRCQDRQIGWGSPADEYADLEASYQDVIGGNRGRKGPFLDLMMELRVTILPTAKVKLLRKKLANPKLVITTPEAKTVMTEFKEPANRTIARELLAEKLKACKAMAKSGKDSSGKKGGKVANMQMRVKD
eukprot:GEMP01043239.1.p1 GENE.GEMP01043239.1~~GEMP01043239.1.p1  ORF type:complete len:194 (+),score=27.50 GEMP01043239.1:66-647(+)